MVFPLHVKADFTTVDTKTPPTDRKMSALGLGQLPCDNTADTGDPLCVCVCVCVCVRVSVCARACVRRVIRIP